MARHRHHRSQARHQENSGGLAWLLTGLALGLFIAALIYLQTREPRHLPPVTTSAERAKPQSADKSAATKPTTKNSSSKEASAKSAGGEKPRYDFYTLLPEMEVVIPKQTTTSKSRSPAPIAEPGTYVIQAGSFKSFQEADALKANLALMGLEAWVVLVTLEDQSSWYRVRLGPYSDLAELNKNMQRLRDNRINAALLKVKE